MKKLFFAAIMLLLSFVGFAQVQFIQTNYQYSNGEAVEVISQFEIGMTTLSYYNVAKDEVWVFSRNIAVENAAYLEMYKTGDHKTIVQGYGFTDESGKLIRVAVVFFTWIRKELFVEHILISDTEVTSAFYTAK